MFEDFYHLTQNPFQINTDPRFLWLGEKHKEALAILQYGVLGHKSFLLLTGDVGTGKTTLINALLRGQGADTLIATIQDPDLSTLDLYNYISYAFGMPDRFSTKGEFLASFRKFLTQNYYNGKKILLIIDESQRLNNLLLEEIRCLSNIEVDGNKLISIFFVGQNEFNDILLQDRNKAIRQRITASYNIKPLTCSEVGKYIDFRLFKAGANRKIFKNDAVKEILKFTNGYPRLINILCDRCLLTGFVLGEKTIGKKIVKDCYAEIDMSMQPITAKKNIHIEDDGKDQSSSSWQLFRDKRMLTTLFLILLLGSSLYFYDMTHNMPPQQSSARLEGQDEQISASSSLLIPPAAPLLKNDLVQGILAEMTEVVLRVRGQSKEQGGEEELPPSLAADIGDKKRSPGNLDATTRGKTALSQAPRYAKKMQIFFPIDSISPAPQYIEDLKIFSDRFKELSGGRIIIRGYTDSSGTARYNKKLAKFRADIVKTFLEARGVDVAKITTLGLISEASSADETLSPPTAEAARRVELEIVLPGSSS